MQLDVYGFLLGAGAEGGGSQEIIKSHTFKKGELIITTSLLLKCGLEQQKDHLPKRRKRLGTSEVYSI